MSINDVLGAGDICPLHVQAVKMWGIVKVKAEHSPDNRVDLFEEFDSILDEDSPPSRGQVYDGKPFSLKKGDML